MNDDPIDPLIGTMLADRYRLESRVGAGGMGTVYRAHDRQTDQACAIKVLLPALESDAVSVARFRQEAELGTRLAHRNLCHVLAHGVSDRGRYYVVMPLLQGDSLFDRTASGTPLPLDDTVRTIHDIAAGLHIAHELGVVHRDLKPENILLVADSDGTERAVLLDFGLAITAGTDSSRRRLTRTGIVVGTPEFMSPEQLSGKPVDRRSDVYALAFLCYEMLTGQLPFGGESMREHAVARLKGELIPIRRWRKDLPIPMERVIARGLAVDPEDRYPSSSAFADALQRAARPGANGVLRWLRR